MLSKKMTKQCMTKKPIKLGKILMLAEKREVDKQALWFAKFWVSCPVSVQGHIRITLLAVK